MYLRGMKLSLQPGTYNAVLTALARAQSGVALHVLGYMDTLDITPDGEAYAALMQMVALSKHSRSLPPHPSPSPLYLSFLPLLSPRCLANLCVQDI